MTDVKKNLWKIPDCAWHRALGDTSKNIVQDMFEITNNETRTKRGIPLGGIGAGNFMLNLCGSFGPWRMKPGRFEDRFLSQAAFHIREEINGKVTTRTLLTEDGLPTWQKLNNGDGDYYALFPRGWFTYNIFETDISLQYFSPIIKDNYKETSFPAAVFLFKISNPSTKKAKVSVMFTFPNAPYTGPHNLDLEKKESGPSPAFHELATQMKGMLSFTLTNMDKPRTGLSNEYVTRPDSPVKAILMKADAPDNPPETQRSEWCIATSGDVTDVVSWDGCGDGKDIWDDFSIDGKLSNDALCMNSAMPSGALSVQVMLESGSEVVIPFVLTWNFPQVEFGSGTRWRRRYTEYFADGESQAFNIAKYVMENVGEYLKDIERWTGTITDNPAYPGWLKAAALNELYYVTFGGSFWENGCITKPKKFGAREGQHLHFTMEALEFRLAESLDVRHHSCRTYRDLWPEIERDILLAYSDFIVDTPDGACPHDVGSVDNDPYFLYDAYWAMFSMISGQSGGRTTTPWSEFSPKFIQQSHAYWKKTGDNGFLDKALPAITRSYAYQKTTDTNDDGISEMKSSEYLDNRLFNGILWIGALEALIDIAKFIGDESLKVDAEGQLAKARDAIERNMWNNRYGYYQFNENNPNLMADAFIGQRYIDNTGLENALNRDRITSHYRNAFRMAALPLPDTDGDGIGNMGAANLAIGAESKGSENSEFEHHLEVWTGVSYALAANMYHWGKKTGDGGLQAIALMIGWGVYQQTWLNDKTAFWFSTPEAWNFRDPVICRNMMYQRARGVWELLMSVHDAFEKAEAD